jgi:hypothetical protein
MGQGELVKADELRGVTREGQGGGRKGGLGTVDTGLTIGLGRGIYCCIQSTRAILGLVSRCLAVLPTRIAGGWLLLLEGGQTATKAGGKIGAEESLKHPSLVPEI